MSFDEPIHLRRIVNLTNLQPRSVQLALQSFIEMKILYAKKNGNRIEYFINDKSPFTHEINTLFRNLNDLETKKKKDSYQNMRKSLEFNLDAKKLLENMRNNNVIN